MRLWSLSPAYLDSRGLVALWREALLAQAVLAGRTRGYTRHPQLTRFREHDQPLAAIGSYLRTIFEEAQQRGYCFNPAPLPPPATVAQIPVTSGQLNYEWQHLMKKLAVRDPSAYEAVRLLTDPKPHPIFFIIPGDIASWEKKGTDIK